MSGMVAATAALALGFAGCQDDTEGGLVGSTCVSNAEYFSVQYFKIIKKECGDCHAFGGQGAKASDFDLAPSSQAGFLDLNLENVRKVAGITDAEGKRVFLEKPLGNMDHGGGPIFSGVEDPKYKQLVELVNRLDASDSCPDTEARFLAGTRMLGPSALVRKAALVLAARLPTQEELDIAEKGGWPAVDKILDNYMEEPAFFARLKEKYNDEMLTDQYADPDEIGAIESDNYSPRWWDDEAFLNNPANITKYGAENSEDLRNKVASWTARGIAQANLELLAYIVRENKSYQEVVTANYMMVNPFSARAFKIPTADQKFVNDADPDEFIPVRLGGYESEYPHAGMLSDPTWLQRHPTTATNRNRHRAKEVMHLFLGNDILKAAERPLDIDEELLGTNPTLNAEFCANCHALLDPIAGTYQNFQPTFENDDDVQFGFRAESDWFPEMAEPGFGNEVMPGKDRRRATQWLGGKIAGDPAFAYAGVFMAYRALTGNDPLPAPINASEENFDGKLTAYLGQYYTFGQIAKKFEASGYNFKSMVKDVVLSPYFRAENAAADIADSQLANLNGVGTAHLLTPEQLNRKVTNVLGMRWTPGGDVFGSPNLLTDGGGEGFKILFGGIDSDNTTLRVTEPSGIMANVMERMGLEMGCRVANAEFALPQSERRWLKSVEMATEPRDVNGYEIAGDIQKIKTDMVYLHERLWGEKLSPSDPEITRTYNLFVSVWDHGKKNIVPVENQFPGQCISDRNYLTGVTLDEASRVVDDSLYTGRAWSAVFAYMLTDYNFVYE
jgi:hypothetical protein